MDLNKIHTGDCKVILKTFPDKSVNCIVTSPPYYGLRDYGNEAQIGLEETPEAYISTMVDVFTECKRVLKDDGTLWLNIGDSYSGSMSTKDSVVNKNSISAKAGHTLGGKSKPIGIIKGLKPKDLIGIPWMLAFALRSSGWYLRQDIIWHKPNPMPESVTDRCTKAHEYIFLLSKSAKYYYDAKSIATPYADKTFTTFGCAVKGNGDGSGLVQSENWANSIKIRKPKEWSKEYGGGGTSFNGHSGHFKANGEPIGDGLANKKSVWTVTTKPFSEAHFATFPEDLIVDCIKAGCPEFVCNKCGKARERLTNCGCNAGFSGGIILDPFMGAGTTALVASKLNRNFIGIELNPEYVKIAEKRLQKELGMFNPLVS